MARDGAGVYSLPAGNPVVSGTDVSSTWANDTLTDLAGEIQDSLSRSGKGSMTVPMKVPDGTEAAPSYAFSSAADTGAYLDGSGYVVFTVDGEDVLKVSPNALSVWAHAEWKAVTRDDATVANLTVTALAVGYVSGIIQASHLRINSGTHAYFQTENDASPSGSSKTIDWTTGNRQYVNMTVNCTFAFTAPTGPSDLRLRLRSNGAVAHAWPAAVKWAGGAAPLWSSTTGHIDMVHFWYDGTNYWGSAVLGYV